MARVVPAGPTPANDRFEELRRRLALTYGQLAETLERSAALADEHLARLARAGRTADSEKERRAAERARDGARRARARARAMSVSEEGSVSAERVRGGSRRT